jgi:hypothetical protein
MKRINVSTDELLGIIEWLDALGATIHTIEDDRGGSDSWLISYTTENN